MVLLLFLLDACDKNQESILVDSADQTNLCAHWKTLPKGIIFVQNGSKIYVGDAAAPRIMVISPTLNIVEKEITTVGPIRAISSSPDGQYAYAVISKLNENNLFIIDTKTDEIIREVKLGGGYPREIAPGSNATACIIWSDPDKISVVNLDKDNIKVVREFANENSSSAIGLDSSMIYIANDKKLQSINLINGKKYSPIPLAGFGQGLSIKPNGREIAVATSTMFEKGRVVFINVKDKSVLSDVAIPGSPDKVLYTNDGKKILVTTYLLKSITASGANGSSSSHLEEYGPPTIIVIDAKNHQIITTIPIKSSIGDGVVSPNSKYAYFITQKFVSNNPIIVNFSIAIIDLTINRVVGEIPVAMPVKKNAAKKCM